METKMRRFFCLFMVLLAFSCGTIRLTPTAELVDKVWEFSQSHPAASITLTAYVFSL